MYSPNAALSWCLGRQLKGRKLSCSAIIAPRLVRYPSRFTVSVVKVLFFSFRIRLYFTNILVDILILFHFTTDRYVNYICLRNRNPFGRDKIVYYIRKVNLSFGETKRLSAELIYVTVSFKGDNNFSQSPSSVFGGTRCSSPEYWGSDTLPFRVPHILFEQGGMRIIIFTDLLFVWSIFESTEVAAFGTIIYNVVVLI